MLREHLLKVKQPMSTTISRFTPPTCTLEIKGKKSPLSGWSNQDILNKFQFKLRFDDPREPTSKQVTVKGNERDFKQLATAIDLYVKEYLASSFKDNLESVAEFKGDRPYVKAQGLVNHELFLGSLTHNGNNKIALSTVQLFDLVTALEAFKSHLATLPDRAKSRKNLPLWGAIAAVAIAGIAITGTLIKSSSQQNIASSPEARSESPTEIPELNEVVPPQQPDRNKQPKSQPKLNDPLSSAKRLPPPPAVDTPKPKPNIPDPADYPLSDIARQSGFDNLAKSETESTVAIPAEPSETTEENIAEPKTTVKSEVDATQNDSSASPTQPRSDIALNPASQTSPIQQVTAYFQEKWQPPAELNQSLEYRLVLNSNGSIERVTPIGKASALYLSKTSIPLNGEPFISPSQVQPATVRLLLSPNGRVQAFSE